MLTLVAGLAALSPPADAFIYDYAASPSTAVPADNTYSGQSYITPDRFPCPSNFKCASVLFNTVHPNAASCTATDRHDRAHYINT